MATVKKKRKLKKSALTTIGKVLMCTFMLAGIVYFISRINSEVSTTFSLQAQLSETKKELAELQKEKEMLIQQREKLTDENYVSSVARSKYLITKDDEQIFVLPSLTDN